jgi:hypothetical protein
LKHFNAETLTSEEKGGWMGAGRKSIADEISDFAMLSGFSVLLGASASPP